MCINDILHKLTLAYVHITRKRCVIYNMASVTLLLQFKHSCVRVTFVSVNRALSCSLKLFIKCMINHDYEIASTFVFLRFKFIWKSTYTMSFCLSKLSFPGSDNRWPLAPRVWLLQSSPRHRLYLDSHLYPDYLLFPLFVFSVALIMHNFILVHVSFNPTWPDFYGHCCKHWCFFHWHCCVCCSVKITKYSFPFDKCLDPFEFWVTHGKLPWEILFKTSHVPGFTHAHISGGCISGSGIVKS